MTVRLRRRGMGVRVTGRAAGWIGVLLLMTACGQGSGGAGGGASPAPSALTGRTFVSVAVTADGKDRPLVDGSRVRLDFGTEGRIGIQAGCNSMGGGYRLQAGRLTLTDGLTTTEMGCSDPLMQQDTWLAGLFTAGAALTLDGDGLTVTSGGTRIALMDERAGVSDADLWRTPWLLDGIDTADTAGTVAAGTSPSLQFEPGPPARVSVQTGCNTGGGPVVAADGSATFGAVAVTRKGCIDPAGTAVENAILSVLQGDSPARYTITGDRLTLSRGAVTLHFRAGPVRTAQPGSTGPGASSAP